MKTIIYQRFGKEYRKMGRDEIIREGCMHSWCLGELFPIMNSQVYGQTPSNFSDERDFFSPVSPVDRLVIKWEEDMEFLNNCPIVHQEESLHSIAATLLGCIKELKESLDKQRKLR